MWGAIGSIAGGVLSGVGSLLGGSGGNEKSALQLQAEGVESQKLGFMSDAINNYSNLYSQFYWPIEQFTAENYYSDVQAARPYEEQMRNYQLGRGNELIGLAEDTNPILDENNKNVIRRLTEGEDVLMDRYRGTASADVASSFNNQRSQDLRSMQQMGVNPSSGVYSNYLSTMGTNEALAQAGARTNAAWQAEDTSLQRNMEAQNWYTNPTMQYNAGTITPGMSISELTGGTGTSTSYGQYNDSQNAGQNNMWGGLGSAIGGIFGGLDQLFSS